MHLSKALIWATRSPRPVILDQTDRVLTLLTITSITAYRGTLRGDCKDAGVPTTCPGISIRSRIRDPPVGWSMGSGKPWWSEDRRNGSTDLSQDDLHSGPVRGIRPEVKRQKGERWIMKVSWAPDWNGVFMSIQTEPESHGRECGLRAGLGGDTRKEGPFICCSPLLSSKLCPKDGPGGTLQNN